MLPTIISLLFSILYLTIVNGNEVHSLEERKMMMFNAQMLQGNKDQLGTQGCFLPKSRYEKGAIILEMKHKDHCTKNKIDSWNKRLQKQLLLDNHRVNSIQKIASTQNIESSKSQIPLTSGINFGVANYLVVLELGGQKIEVAIDTGSALTWVQCEPCKSCYDQLLPIFNPSNSSSYQTVLCNSSACESINYPDYILCETMSVSASCSYEVDYLDGSYSNGILGIENISLGNFSNRSFVFGCGNNNKGMFGETSGIMGLGKGELSLISQIEELGGVFSYCIPEFQENASSGSLTFGNDFSFFKNETPISYTNMVIKTLWPNLYLLNLIGVNVGGVDLPFTSLSTIGGVAIDSGTVITRLIPSIYDALREEFLRQFSDFPRIPAFEILDTCFDLTGHQDVKIPTISMNFEGNVELNVSVSGILLPIEEDGSKACLAFAPLSDDLEMSIIGNYQQINQRVIYNTKESVVGFARETCSFN